MKPNQIYAYKLSQLRYLGLYKYHLYQLYLNYAIPRTYVLDVDRLIAALRDMTGGMLWDTSGSAMLSPTHFDLLYRYIGNTGNLSVEDLRVLHHTKELLRWHANLDRLKGDIPSRLPMQHNNSNSFAVVDVVNFYNGGLEFHSYLENPNVRDAFEDSLGKDPAIQDFMSAMKLQDDRVSVDILSAFDGTFNLGSDTPFEAAIVKWNRDNNGESWWRWFLRQTSFRDYHTEGIGTTNGYFLIKPEVERTFVSFPDFLTQFIDFNPSDIPEDLPYHLGLTGIFCPGSKLNLPGFDFSIDDMNDYPGEDVANAYPLGDIEVTKLDDASSLSLGGDKIQIYTQPAFEASSTD